MNYISSIVSKHGDIENVKKDSLVIMDIINRQGTSLVIDCLAEHVGRVALKFKLRLNESRLARNKVVKELNSAINERI